MGVEELEEEDVLGTGFLDHVAASFAARRLLCDVVKIPF